MKSSHSCGSKHKLGLENQRHMQLAHDWLSTGKTQKVNTECGNTTSLMGMAMIWWRLETTLKFSILLRFTSGQDRPLCSQETAGKRKKTTTKKENHCGEYNLLNLSNLSIKLRWIWDRGNYSDVIWSDFAVWYKAIENAQGQFKEQARWVSCIKMGMKNNPENAIYCKNCRHA